MTTTLMGVSEFPEVSVEQCEERMRYLRDQYADIPRVVACVTLSEMLTVLISLAEQLWRGEERPGSKEDRFKNYSNCAEHVASLRNLVAVLRAANA